jgi:hypothetical protein
MASEYSALMNCAHIRPLLSAYADKETTEVESALIKRHLACCSSCASELAFAQAMNTSLFTMPLSVPPPDLFDSIAAATYSRPTLRQRFAQWLAPAPTRWTMGTAIATCLTIAIIAPRLGTGIYPSQGDIAIKNRPSRPAAVSPKGETKAGGDNSAVAVNQSETKTIKSETKTIKSETKTIKSETKTIKSETKTIKSVANLNVNSATVSTDEVQARNETVAQSATGAPDKAPLQATPHSLTEKAKPSDNRIAGTTSASAVANDMSRFMKSGISPASESKSAVKPRPETQMAINPVKSIRKESGVIKIESVPSVAHPVGTVAVIEPKHSPAPVTSAKTPDSKEPENTTHEGAPDVRVAVAPHDPEPAPGTQVAMAESSRASHGFRLTLRNAGTNQRQNVNFPSPPNLRPNTVSFATDSSRIQLVSDNDRVDRLDTDRVTSLK